MARLEPAAQPDLLEVMLARRAQIRMRLGLGVAIAVVFHQLTGWTESLSWLGAYWLGQGVEQLIYRPDRARRILAGPAGRAATLAMLVMHQFVFGALALLQARSGTPWGIGCAVLLICGAIMNGVLTSRGSRASFTAMMAADALFFPAIPWIAHVPIWSMAALAAGGLIYVLTAAMVWLAASRAMAAERRERHNSDARRAEAEDAVAAKSAFVAVVSHELRTPISAILAGAAELERSGDAHVRANARLIGDAGAMMRALLNDLLDRSKLDAGRMTVENVAFDLRALLVDQMRFWRAEARKKGLRLAFRGAPATPAMVQGDPTRIRQILNNLISNALKFTEAGGVVVALARAETADADLALTISVTDTGPGMTDDQMSRLFTPFEQLEASIARNHGGTGLGLAISRDLARLMGGDITARSAPERGATFILSLNLAAGEAGAAAPAPAYAAQSRPARVLVVDDHEINRRAMSLILEPLGAEVVAVASAADALDQLAERPFDVVLMDCYMPGMDGRAATRILRGAPGPNRATPVIAVTASSSPEDIRECKAAGMTTHIAKPIDPAALHAALAEVLDAAPAKVAAAA